MSYLEDIKGFIEHSKDIALEPTVSCIIGKGAVVEGFKKILSYSSECLLIVLARCKVKISGSGLTLSKINSDELIIRGNICKMEIINE